MKAGEGGDNRSAATLGETEAQRTLPEPELGLDCFCYRGREAGKFTRQSRLPHVGATQRCPRSEL